MDHARPFRPDGWWERDGRDDAEPPVDLDLSGPSPARVYDHLLGGKDNYETDRALAERMLRVQPMLGLAARQNRAFVGRAVRRLAQAGFSQFLDIGCGLPARDNVHQIADRTMPGARVVYVDNDPVVLAHGRALLVENANVAVLRADLRDPEHVLDTVRAGRLLDFQRPVAVLLTAVLHFLADADGPQEAVARIRRALPAGSALAVSHLASDVATAATAEAARLFAAECGRPLVPRGREEVAGFFGDLAPVDPGLVFTGEWWPDIASQPPEHSLMYAGVACSRPLSSPPAETTARPESRPSGCNPVHLV
ncbi:S-adenosyl methyltransferase [Thermomonospora echinospora]|uniref:S-adenosyl methyltransferase n=1 Tax=Thermomonospora echinospora TaxID=1992 RepID=A0A1H6C996_9ACTN|nr:SAM-dependent methyltransferase [Thermomonospora echinospora]SEG69541.1 S-adenosyl methyltransferase [Thermomonospora echinospora]